MPKTAKKGAKKAATRELRAKVPAAGTVSQSTEGWARHESLGDGTARESIMVRSDGTFPEAPEAHEDSEPVGSEMVTEDGE